MVKIINSIYFRSAIQYNQEKIELLNKICEPLSRYFSISEFGYWKIFNDGRYILLSNSIPFQEVVACYDFCFRSEYFHNQTQFLYKNETYKQVWPTETADEAIKILRSRRVFNGFNVIRESRESPGSVDTYFFATSEESPLIKNFYIKHFSVIEKFILCFHQVGNDIINEQDFTKQGISPYLKEHYPDISTIFAGTTPWHAQISNFEIELYKIIKKSLYIIEDKNCFSNRELECLIQTFFRKTAKEIARTLNISHRTVETHIKHILMKTKCNNNKELLEWFNSKNKNLVRDLSMIEYLERLKKPLR